MQRTKNEPTTLGLHLPHFTD